VLQNAPMTFLNVGGRPTAILRTIAVAVLLIGKTASAEPSWRIAVTDLQALDVEVDDPPARTAAIAGEIGKHAGFTVLPLADVRAILGLDRPMDCASKPDCIRKLAETLKADQIVFASVVSDEKKFELTLTRVDPKNPAAAQRASETMRKLDSIDLNVPLCLDRLFQWDSQPPPAPLAPAEGPQLIALSNKPAPADGPQLIPLPNAAAPATAPKPKRPMLAVLGVRGEAGLTADQVRSVEEILLAAVDATQRFSVIGRSDITAML